MYNENKIKFCKYCGCEKFKHISKDKIDFIVLEYSVVCENCGETINYWSFGCYENDNFITPDYIQMLRKKKIKKLSEISKDKQKSGKTNN